MPALSIGMPVPGAVIAEVWSTMRHDVWQLDGELTKLRDRRRDGLAAFASSELEDIDPFHSPLFRIHEELAESEDPVGLAIAEWLDVLVIERATWVDRGKLERAWDQVREVADIDAPISLRVLRNTALKERRRLKQSFYQDGFQRYSSHASDRAVSPLVWRLEREGERYFEVDGVQTCVAVAERVLEDTRDFVADIDGTMLELARRAVCADAAEGWPAQLTTRWMQEVFRAGGLGEGLDVRLGAPPEVWGAMSFARAFGHLGVAVFDATRPRTLPAALHKRPRGYRQHARRVLFANVITEAPFARAWLGLGTDRARDHQRKVCRAACLSVRFDALRVLLTHALLEGEGTARERMCELTDRHFGGAADPRMLGVLPRLRPADGPALVGAVMAHVERAELLSEHDEDWFRNPHAIEQIRHEDEQPVGDAKTAERLAAGVGMMVDRWSQLIG